MMPTLRMQPLSVSTVFTDSLTMLGLPNLPRALCKEADPSIFFGDHEHVPECDTHGCAGKSEAGRVARIAEAKALCRKCPERIACAIWAIDNNVPFGIWGALGERERTRMRLEGRYPE